MTTNSTGRSYKQGGLVEKYAIQKRKVVEIDGKSTVVLVDVDADALYFVLRYDKDPHARVALKAYAKSVESENPKLSSDIFNKLEKTEQDFRLKLKLDELPEHNFFTTGEFDR